ncbi:hypothetical protein [Sphingosinicella sp. CPCC 101087]|uniref:hypothetical protein n=1 Tax=Sphingosinicella sp. CPCC 101087 TaxID=2497754 RepID=UPI00101E11CB|nr:hypothetical protein [Sphingosinicella sp. CPCC 101087]
MKTFLPFVAVALLGLGACGTQSPAENAADSLEDAAEQSTPEAAGILENAADAAREGNDPAVVDEALNAAANAQTPPPPEVQRNGQ